MKTKNMLVTALYAGLAVSCIQESGTVRIVEDGNPERTVVLNFIEDTYPQSKSSLGAGIENLFTGAVLAVYSSTTGALELEVEIPESGIGKGIPVTLPATGSYDMYLVGNLRLLDEQGGAEYPDFPLSSSEMEGFEYRLDGGNAGGGFRRERFDEVSRWGIPLCWSRKGVDPDTDTSLDIVMERLFSKVVLVVDHSGLVGSNMEALAEGSVQICQSNSVLLPFSAEGAKAESDEDVLPVSDFDCKAENTLTEEYVFYVPENRQGVLMPGNSDPGEKDIDGVEKACGGSGISRLLTYLEYKSHLDDAGNGISGDIVCRFFLGRNALTDFDVERNREIRVTLMFNAESVFEPDWKLDNDGISDSRQLYLSGNLAGRLPEGKEIYVRKNRPGTFNINISAGEEGENIISSARLVDPGYRTGSLTEIAWTSNFWTAGHDPVQEPARVLLEELGIGVSYEDGSFTFSVTDPDRFVPGHRVPLRIRMYPGGIETSATIVTADDMVLSLEGGESLDENFFLGQKRSLSLTGIAGSRIYYVADQDEVGSTGIGKHIFNRQWKTDPDQSSAFPGCIIDQSGDVVYPYMDYGSYEGQYINVGERLDVYAFYPNDFVSGKPRTVKGKIFLCTDDVHNDGLVEIPLKISMPWYDGTIDAVEPLQIPVDGKQVPLDIGYYTGEGGEEMEISDFDPELYELLLKPRTGWDASDWQQCIRITDDISGMYLFSTVLNGRRIEKEFSGSSYLGKLAIAGNPYTGLYSETDIVECNISLPSGIGTVVQKSGKDYFNGTGTSGIIRFEAPCEYAAGDLNQVDVAAEGPCVEYACTIAKGETYGSVLDIGYSGGTVSVTFDETRQAKTSSAGEFVPGGLLVPYGDYRLVLGVTNRWDNRRLEYTADFAIDYRINLKQFTIFSPKRYATVVLVSEKNSEYLEKYGPTASQETLMFLLESVGSREWNEHISVTGPSYCINGKYHLNEDKVYYVPPSDFDVKFLNQNAATWNGSLADAVCSQGVTPWLNSVYFHKNGVLAGTSAEGDTEITGSRNISLLRIMPQDAGHIYRSVRFDWQ